MDDLYELLKEANRRYTASQENVHALLEERDALQARVAELEAVLGSKVPEPEPTRDEVIGRLIAHIDVLHRTHRFYVSGNAN